MGAISSIYGNLVQPIDKMAAKGMRVVEETSEANREILRTVEVELVGLRKYGAVVKNISFADRRLGVYSVGTICLKCHKPKDGHYRYCRFCGMRFLGGLYEDEDCARMHEGAFVDSKGCCGVCCSPVDDATNFCPECGTMIVRRDKETGMVVQIGAEFWGRDFDPSACETTHFVGC